FIVPEKPTSGVERAALLAALDCGRTLAGPAAPIRVLGPTFSGSAESLGAALREWNGKNEPGKTTGRPDETRRAFRIVSGTATNPNTKAELEKGGLSEYATTVHSTDVLANTLYTYLLQHGLEADPSRCEIAILTERTTRYGQGFVESVKTASAGVARGVRARLGRGGDFEGIDTLVLPFPLHVSWLLGEGDEVSGKPSKGDKAPSEDETVATTLG